MTWKNEDKHVCSPATEGRILLLKVMSVTGPSFGASTGHVVFGIGFVHDNLQESPDNLIRPKRQPQQFAFTASYDMHVYVNGIVRHSACMKGGVTGTPFFLQVGGIG